VRNRYVVAVYRVAVDAFLRRCLWVLVDDQLMAVEIEVYPLVAGATFGKTEHLTVEVTCGGQIVDGNCQMERGEAHGDFLLICFDLNQFLSGNTVGKSANSES